MEMVTVRTTTGDSVGAHPDRVATLVDLGMLRELREGIYVIMEDLDANIKAALDAAFDVAGVFV